MQKRRFNLFVLDDFVFPLLYVCIYCVAHIGKSEDEKMCLSPIYGVGYI